MIVRLQMVMMLVVSLLWAGPAGAQSPQATEPTAAPPQVQLNTGSTRPLRFVGAVPRRQLFDPLLPDPAPRLNNQAWDTEPQEAAARSCQTACSQQRHSCAMVGLPSNCSQQWVLCRSDCRPN